MEIFFPSKFVRYIAVQDDYDTIKQNNDMGPIRNMFNDWDTRDISKKVKAGKRVRALNGQSTNGRTPYGYMKDPAQKGQIIPNPETAPVVQQIFELALRGTSKMEIARILTAQKILIPAFYLSTKGDNGLLHIVREKPNKEYTWNNNLVNYILNNQMYVGDFVYLRHETINHKTRQSIKVPKERQIIIPYHHEPLITREVFTKVREMTVSKYRPRKNNHENLFRGFVVCPECNHKMVLSAWGKGKYKKPIYVCNYHLQHPQECLHSHSLYYDSLKEIVITRLRSFINIVKDDQKLLSLVKQQADDLISKNKIQNEINKLNARLGILGRLIRKLYEDLILEVINQDNYQTMVKDYQDEQAQLNLKLKEAEILLAQKNDEASIISELKNVVEEFGQFQDLTKEIVSKFIDKIEVDYTKVVDGKKYKEVRIFYRFFNIVN